MLETKIWPVEEMVHEDEFTDRVELLRELDQWIITNWDGKDDGGQALPSGLYFFDLRTADGLEVRKVILAR